MKFASVLITPILLDFWVCWACKFWKFGRSEKSPLIDVWSPRKIPYLLPPKDIFRLGSSIFWHDGAATIYTVHVNCSKAFSSFYAFSGNFEKLFLVQKWPRPHRHHSRRNCVWSVMTSRQGITTEFRPVTDGEWERQRQCYSHFSKTFFRRTIMKNQKFTCQYDGKCPVDKSIRCACRHCRFEKCLQVGMDRNGMRKQKQSFRIFQLFNKTVILSGTRRGHVDIHRLKN